MYALSSFDHFLFRLFPALIPAWIRVFCTVDNKQNQHFFPLQMCLIWIYKFASLRFFPLFRFSIICSKIKLFFSNDELHIIYDYSNLLFMFIFWIYFPQKSLFDVRVDSKLSQGILLTIVLQGDNECCIVIIFAWFKKSCFCETRFEFFTLRQSNQKYKKYIFSAHCECSRKFSTGHKQVHICIIWVIL